MIFGAILAGGIGSRLNISSVPKQFLMLGNKPIIIHTIEKFLMCEKLDYVYVGINKNWVYYMNDLINEYEQSIDDPEVTINEYNIDTSRVKVTEGGSDRNLTLLNVINAIEKEYGESSENIIVTHDAVRPFVTLRMIEENIDAAIKYGACDTAVASIDTIVMSQDASFISEIPNRKEMYQGQTPQSFNMSMIKRLYMDLSEEEKAILTDACKICTVRNVPVKIVDGDTSNIKITTVGDYKIAQAMLGGITVD